MKSRINVIALKMLCYFILDQVELRSLKIGLWDPDKADIYSFLMPDMVEELFIRFKYLDYWLLQI